MNTTMSKTAPSPQPSKKLPIFVAMRDRTHAGQDPQKWIKVTTRIKIAMPQCVMKGKVHDKVDDEDHRAK